MRFEERLKRLELLEQQYHRRERAEVPLGAGGRPQADALEEEEVLDLIASGLRNNLIAFAGWADCRCLLPDGDGREAFWRRIAERVSYILGRDGKYFIPLTDDEMRQALEQLEDGLLQIRRCLNCERAGTLSCPGCERPGTPIEIATFTPIYRRDASGCLTLAEALRRALVAFERQGSSLGWPSPEPTNEWVAWWLRVLLGEEGAEDDGIQEL